MRYLFWQGFRDTVADEHMHTWDVEKNASLRRFSAHEDKRRFASISEHVKVLYASSSRRIDYILVNGAGEVLEAGLCANRIYVGLPPSDHFVVLARVALCGGEVESNARRAPS